MKDYGKVRSTKEPQTVEVRDTMVFVASNIQPYNETIDEYELSGYEYDYVVYDKNEYIQSLTAANTQAIADLEEQLAAAKILLGVD